MYVCLFVNLHVCMSNCLPVCVCVFLFVCLPACLSSSPFVCLPAYRSSWLTLCLRVCPSVCLSECVFLFVCLPICLPVRLPACLYVCMCVPLPLFVSLFAYLCFFLFACLHVCLPVCLPACISACLCHSYISVLLRRWPKPAMCCQHLHRACLSVNDKFIASGFVRRLSTRTIPWFCKNRKLDCLSVTRADNRNRFISDFHCSTFARYCKLSPGNTRCKEVLYRVGWPYVPVVTVLWGTSRCPNHLCKKAK